MTTPILVRRIDLSHPGPSPTCGSLSYHVLMESLDYRRDLIETRLEDVIEAVDQESVSEEMRHVTLSGGKRVRPMITILSCEAAGGDPEAAVDFAVGIELVHSASLVVDDIIDQSNLRRGTDSAWTAFGYGPAIIASDGLLGEAFSLFATNPDATRTVAEAMIELGEGEASELTDQRIDKVAYLTLARRKTGALFRAAAELGAIAAEADQATVDAYGEYAERVGVAFQIRDDVLDATADADALGKPTGRDVAMDRPSIVQATALSLEEADDHAREEIEHALAALDRAAPVNADAEQYLRDLATFVIQRDR